MSVERMSIAAQCYFIFLMKFGETQLKEISQEIIQAPLIHLNPNSQTQEFLEAEFIKSGYLVNGEFTEKAITHNYIIKYLIFCMESVFCDKINGTQFYRDE
ncbi:hypothetical protein [Leptospira borgpetersenii]|uniref:Uncharacterized protein n=2 Tax=Leptospira borgpetersenii TaxID=174 RepID=Q04TF9_LEPBJ|nr:hypothetical protein [Leptospira borgpetersenii]ABJ75811.1 Hypothetical protein LBJ_1207 [Leptospira borgpetersenii serovar Hardjo-bovis str. JB197]ABJ78757.1 Hypothetical protein LBL_1259 [Leptospira borgpetersenii serovar Hardjo-bovis str. L550]AMX58024.1 hypothetical protein LBK6_06615 [Leptospira borgpetersenii serovar Hardjo]AMX61276.1 hypothetical protein LBK9_06640 [Leptospira borgpetersenii serovar Hardjo]AMX64521.1 hypothetical protein LBK30_06695 [Leptospira borgpetersenii serovar